MVGNGIFKNFRYSEGNLKTFNIQKVEPQNYLCHAWVSEERVIVGTDTGRLMLFEAGEMKHEFNIAAQEKEKYVFLNILLFIKTIDMTKTKLNCLYFVRKSYI